MGKKIRDIGDGLDPYSDGDGRRKRVGDISPFDRDNVENFRDMEIKLSKKVPKVVSDQIGKENIIKDDLMFQNERRFIK